MISTLDCPSPYTLVARMTIFENDYFEFESRASSHAKQTAVSESLNLHRQHNFLMFPQISQLYA